MVYGAMIKLRDLLIVFCLCLLSFLSKADPGPKFGLGTPAFAQEISAWDIDIRPDGRGLPSGSGNAKEGRKIYQQQCAACHGDKGQGGPNDQLVGRFERDVFLFSGAKTPKKTIGNYWPWASTLFDYVRRAMPYTSPGSLTDTEVYSVSAYLLYANGIITEDHILDAKSLPAIKMPAQDRFVPDNRSETNSVR